MKSGRLPLALAAFSILLLLAAFVFPPSAYGSSVFYVSLSFSVAAYLLASWHAGRGKEFSYLGISAKKKELPALMLQGAILAAACIALTWMISGILFLAGLLDTGPVLEKVSRLPIPALIIAFTLAPLGEELLFRGFVFRYLWWSFESEHDKGNMAWLGAALLTSAVFALLHAGYGSFAELAVAFSIGMALCFSVKRSNSLIPAIIAHALFNLASVISVSLL